MTCWVDQLIISKRSDQTTTMLSNIETLKDFSFHDPAPMSPQLLCDVVFELLYRMTKPWVVFCKIEDVG